MSPTATTVFDQAPPSFSAVEIHAIARECFGLAGEIAPLVSERDQNALLHTTEGDHVLKIANAGEDRAALEFQNAALKHLERVAPDLGVPRIRPARSGEAITTWPGADGRSSHLVRAVSYLPGKLLGEVPRTPALLESLGRFMGRLSRALQGFGHPAAHRRDFLWNLDSVNSNGDGSGASCRSYLGDIARAEDRLLVEQVLDRHAARVAPRLPHLRGAVIHQDGNDNNVIVAADDPSRVVGLIDFGDMLFGRQVNELAVTMAYALMGTPDVVAFARPLIRGYHAGFSLTEDELAVLFDLVAARLAMSVCISSHRARDYPANEYLLISQKPAFRLLRQLDRIHPHFLHLAAREAAGLVPVPGHDTMVAWLRSPDCKPVPVLGLDPAVLLARRAEVLGPSLSVSYRKKLAIVRGRGSYLYDHTGRAYLDCVNNVCHVGHCHPRVVAALSGQAAILNTNTRYLHDTILAYAERITATMPDPLRVVYFVCSGSEANELALRLARAATGRHDIIVVDWGYHGNTQSLIEASPYKFQRRGGAGKPDHVHIAALPDPYRGPHKGYSDETGQAYARSVADRIADVRARTGAGPAAFLAESISGCGGQIVFPDGYLRRAFELVRDAGGVCIADEVQVGFGRVGDAMWAFQPQGALPDIVTLGKPMGNGHPLAAVVTTRAIADAFANGMEYFNSFGGNPVSCAIGMAVLDVIEQEGLQQRALDTGNHLLERLRDLATRHELIGDVRGRGMYLGVELVRDRATLEPATAEASDVINILRERGVLVSTDGPLDNVLKVKPPIVFGRTEADILCDELDAALTRAARIRR